MTVGARPECEHHHKGGDDEHTRNDLHTQFHTHLATIEQRVEETQKQGFFFFGVVLLGFLGFFRAGTCHFFHQLGARLAHKTLHQPSGNNAARHRTNESHYCSGAIAAAYHKHHHHKAHTKGGAEVGERNQLIFAKVAAEADILAKADDCRVVAHEGHHRTKGCHTGQIVERSHERTQQFLEYGNHAKLHKQAAKCAGEYGDSHKIEHRLQKQMVARVHHCVEHIGCAHHISHISKDNSKKYYQSHWLDNFSAHFSRY